MLLCFVCSIVHPFNPFCYLGSSFFVLFNKCYDCIVVSVVGRYCFVVLVAVGIIVAILVLQLFLFYLLHSVLLVIASGLFCSMFWFVFLGLSQAYFFVVFLFKFCLFRPVLSQPRVQGTRKWKRERGDKNMMQVGHQKILENNEPPCHLAARVLRSLFWKCSCWDIKSNRVQSHFVKRGPETAILIKGICQHWTQIRELVHAPRES